MLDAVVAGIGIGVLPCFITTNVRGIECLEEVGRPEAEDIWLVTHQDARGIERVRIVAEWLLRLFAEHADWLAGARAP
jgi:DNA-binding transcriptional LysR family regulator